MNENDIIPLFREIISITGIYQKDLAQLLGISDRFMKRLMSGRDKPSERLLERIGIKTIKNYEFDHTSQKLQSFILQLEDLAERNGKNTQLIKNLHHQK